MVAHLIATLYLNFRRDQKDIRFLFATQGPKNKTEVLKRKKKKIH